MARTPQEWLSVLASRIDKRRPRIDRLRRYMNGDADLPEMGKNLRASWERFQRKARTNTGGLVIDALAERIVPNGIVVGDDVDSPAAKTARRVWRDNRMDVEFKDAIRNMFGLSIGYLAVGRDENGHAVITSEQPEFMIAATDPIRPWITRAALKAWRDPDDGFDYAYVWLVGGKQLFRRPSMDGDQKQINRVSGDWVTVGELEEYSGRPPIHVFENPDGLGEFEPHIDVIDRINSGILQRLVTVSMQAFRQRALKPDANTGGLSDKDEDGNDINWAQAFEPAPGALWELPDGISIWESQQTDVTPMLSSVKEDFRDLCSSTRTPLAMMMPGGENQTAEGAAFAREGLVLKAHDRIARVSQPLNVTVVEALIIEGVDLEDKSVEVRFEPPAWVSLTEKYAAAAQAKATGLSLKTIMRNIIGMSEVEIAQDEQDRTDEQLSLMMLTQSQQPAQSGESTPPPSSLRKT